MAQVNFAEVDFIMEDIRDYDFNNCSSSYIHFYFTIYAKER